MASPQYIQKLFHKYIDSKVLNFKEDEIITNLVELEERPLFPDLDKTLKEQAKNMNSKSVKEIRSILAGKFSGLKAMTKGKLASLDKKLRSAQLSMALNEKNRENILLDIESMLQKFFSQNLQKQDNSSQPFFPQDHYGEMSFKLSQVSPMIQTLLQKDAYKKVKLGNRQMFGITGDKILRGRSVDEMGKEFDK